MKWWLFVVMACSAFAGDVDGAFYDLSGAPLAQVRVRLWISGRSVAEATTSFPTARFRFPDVPAGSYLLTAETEGFRRHASVVPVLADRSTSLGAVELKFGSCDYSGIVCDFRVADVCDALSHVDRRELVVLIGVMEEPGGLGGNCEQVLSVGEFRFPSRITIERSREPALDSPRKEKEIRNAVAKMRKQVGPGPKIVAVYGFLDFFDGLKKSRCKGDACVPNIPLAPAQLIGIEGYREFP